MPNAHFRVLIGDVECGVMSVGPLHDLVDGEADPDIRQRVVLRRAVSRDRHWYDWYRSSVAGKDGERTLTVAQLDRPDGRVVNVWRLDKARPVRWTGPQFDALSDEFATEEIEVRYASVRWRRRL